jgi:hypothetical protein
LSVVLVMFITPFRATHFQSPCGLGVPAGVGPGLTPSRNPTGEGSKGGAQHRRSEPLQRSGPLDTKG